MIFKILGVPPPLVALRDKETTESAVGVTVLAAVVPGTLTKKSELLISEEEIVAKLGAPLVVAFRYWPVVPLVIEARVSVEEV